MLYLSFCFPLLPFNSLQSQNAFEVSSVIMSGVSLYTRVIKYQIKEIIMAL